MKKLLVYNDDGWSSLMRYPAPCSVEEIARHTVGLVAGTGVDIYQMCLLTGNVAIHHSRILEKYGEHLGKPYRMHMWRTIENMKALEAQGTDLLRIVVEHCHKAGIEAHASLRINDKHHTYKMEPNPAMPERFCRSEYVFPDLRSGWVDERTHMYLQDGSMDFSFEEIRQLRLDTIEEVLNHYELDGIDLDFTRFPPFFKEGEKEKNAGLITDMVRRARLLTEKRSKETGRKIKLTARVEYDPAVNLAEGLDVAGWVREGYLDILYLGVIADCTPDAPIDDYVNMCRGTGCKVCPSLEGQFYWVGGMNRMGPVRVPTVEMARALAANTYDAGGEGIQLFNFCCADGPWDRRILDEIPYPEQIRFKDKLYYFTMAPWRSFNLTCRWDSRLMLRYGQTEACYSFTTAENVELAESLYQQPVGRLMMRIMGLNKREDVEFRLNGKVLVPGREAENYWDWDGWSDILYFDVQAETLKKGRNELKIARTKENEGYIGEIEVIELELAVIYPKSNVIGGI
jgi:hypothetical protein